MEIKVDDLTSEAIAEFINEHLADSNKISPPASIHALSIEHLRRPEITFWSMWEGVDLLGCGALKELDPQHAEIKSMRTAVVHRRKGVASRLLQHILLEARRRNYNRVSLETGSMAAFAPARSLYLRFGFKECGPFGDYIEDSNSVFMTMEF